MSVSSWLRDRSTRVASRGGTSHWRRRGASARSQPAEAEAEYRKAPGDSAEAGRRRPGRHRLPRPPGAGPNLSRLSAGGNRQAGGGGGRVSPGSGSVRETDRPRTEDPTPLRAVHTSNFPALLRQLGASLLVTTYQAGKLVLVRDEGDHLNTHYRAFQAPMGMALAGGRLAVGTKIQVWEFVDNPAVDRQARPARPARRLLPAPLQPRHGQHPDPRDGLRRRRRTLGRQHPVLLPRHARRLEASFTPRWRPPFVTDAGAHRTAAT